MAEVPESSPPARSRLFMRLVGVMLLLPFLFEIGLRFLSPHALDYYRKVKLLHRYHPEYNVTLAPNEDLYIRHFHGVWEGRFTMNSLGFRGSPEPDATRPQVACLGDSLVMGFGVSDEETFCHQLSGVRLGDGTEAQALNLGVDAFGSLGSALRLKEAVEQPGVDLNVALFFPSPNDFTIPPALAEQGVVPDDITDAVRYNDENYKFWFRLQFEATRYSYFLMALKLSLEQLRVRWTITRGAIKDELTRAGFLGEGPFFARLGSYLTDAFYRGAPPPPAPTPEPAVAPTCPEPLPSYMKPCVDAQPDPRSLPPLLDVTVKAYDSMLATARAKDFQLVVVLLPIQAETLYCKNLGQYSDFFDFGLRAARYFEARDVPVIDLRDYIPRMCGPWELAGPDGTPRTEHKFIRDFFIPGDGHLTVLGNQWAAEAIRIELERLSGEGRL